MSPERPNIPVGHFLEQCREAMVESLTFLEEEGPKGLQKQLRARSGSSRIWFFLLRAYENHDEDHRWFSSWCKACIPIL